MHNERTEDVDKWSSLLKKNGTVSPEDRARVFSPYHVYAVLKTERRKQNTASQMCLCGHGCQRNAYNHSWISA